jgi:hypothetical protein
MVWERLKSFRWSQADDIFSRRSSIVVVVVVLAVIVVVGLIFIAHSLLVNESTKRRA